MDKEQLAAEHVQENIYGILLTMHGQRDLSK
jgi:hypothetical protein